MFTPELMQILLAAAGALAGYFLRHFDGFKLHGLAVPVVPGPAPGPVAPVAPVAPAQVTVYAQPAIPSASLTADILARVETHLAEKEEQKKAAKAKKVAALFDVAAD